MGPFEQMYRITKVQLSNTIHERDEYRRMAECAAIMAVCGYFSRMRWPDAYAWMNGHCAIWEVEIRKICHESLGLNRVPLYAGSAPVPAAQAKVADDVRLGNRLYVWDYENPEDGSWDNIEEYLHDTTPGVGDVVRLNLAMPLQDVEVEMLEVGRSGEPIRWQVRDVKTGDMLAAKAKGGGK